MKNKSTAVILAIIFDELGNHHFYLSNTKYGLKYIILWLVYGGTVFVPVFFWIIEFIEEINLANKSQCEFDTLYNLNLLENQYFNNDINYNHTSNYLKIRPNSYLT